MIKYIFAVLLLFYLAFSGGCNKTERYDDGYEAGWAGREEPSRWASKAEKEGYKDGAEDAETYDDGYFDGYNKKSPEYLNDELYMEGYEDGKAHSYK